MQSDPIEDISELVLVWAQFTERSPRDIVPATLTDTICLPHGIADLREWRLEECHDRDYRDWMPFHIDDNGMCERVAYVNTNRRSPRHNHRLVIQYWHHNGPVLKQEFDGSASRVQIHEHVMVPGWIWIDDVCMYYSGNGIVRQLSLSSLYFTAMNGLQAGA